MDLVEPGPDDYRFNFADVKNGPNALTAPTKPGDIVILKTNAFEFEAEVVSITSSHFTGKIVTSPYKNLIGNEVDFHYRYIWGRNIG